ncbi:unnamed protein product [Bursaphelenchus xylophilus]|uniref:(pine wood nematode) hypothetical protein n=1 Tax=Bursaphelenchus xylophilus TaxID=6326 RepID=A0A7I8XQB1_BURXY|nr:unnamed protein product [Bursaphelenchus xylophilus]CAG9122064.1 unnamed protein product [Bursaphelenchus xylophilus]
MARLKAVSSVLTNKTEISLCEYYKAIGKRSAYCDKVEKAEDNGASNKLHVCSSNSAMVLCTADTTGDCAESGQICTLSDHTKCCQGIVKGIPVSRINAKPGDCPQPIGISGFPDQSSTGCWLDSNCPGVQKCCLEPNPTAHNAQRVCRDPIGISKFLGNSVCNLPLAVGTCTAPVTRYYYDSVSGQCKTFKFSGCNGNANNFQSLASCQATCSYLGIQGTPLCPADANASLNCLYVHPDACQTDADCMGRQNNVQPSCCMTKCGYRICHLY